MMIMPSMAAGIPDLDPQDLVEEMQSLDLGDTRRSARMLQAIAAMAQAPSGSLASMTESEADLEAMYRLFRNPKYTWEDVLRPHIHCTMQRARGARVIAVHDTSSFRVEDDADLGSYLNTGKQGFLAHVSLLIEEGGVNVPLGVAGVELLMRPKEQRRTKTQAGRKMSGSATSKLQGREFLRWWRGVESVNNRIEQVEELTHVMDRECDSYELLSQMVQSGSRFVVRMCKNRNARRADEDDPWEALRTVLEQAERTRIVREVQLSKRVAKTAPGANRAAPPRETRLATLEMAHVRIELKKPRYLSESDGWPATLPINVVRVYEPQCPEDQEPVEWILLTNLPTDAESSVERVVDTYRLRWLIEEYFKVHKTGCGYRTRRLTNPQSILNTFAACVPIAWKALALRHLAQDAQQPAERVLSASELQVLQAKAKSMGLTLPPAPTAAEALATVAQIGGHRRSKGPPGWMIIARGLEKLHNLAEGWALARGLEM